MNEETPSGTKLTRRTILQAGAAAGIGLATPWVWTSRKAGAQTIILGTINDPRYLTPVVNPRSIPQFVDDLPVIDANNGFIWPTITGDQILAVQKIDAQILPVGTNLTSPCWGYRNQGQAAYSGTYLGPTYVVVAGTTVKVTYDYAGVAGTTHLLEKGDGSASVVDKHVHGTDGMQCPTGTQDEPERRFIAHLHGGKDVAADSDGYSEAWVTPDGKTYLDFGTPPCSFTPAVENKTTLTYPNKQDATLKWYHDHALGITRLNVYAGLAGAYLLRDAAEDALGLPQVPYEVPLVIQDRMFYPDGRLAYPDQTWVSPPGFQMFPLGDVSTFPEFFPDCMVVNGKTWPRLVVEQTTYRCRFLNGCQSRVLDLGLSTRGGRSPAFTIIGTEGGLLNAPVQATSFVMGPAERFDVIIDFSRLPVGAEVTLTNKGAKKPYPGGTPPDPRTDGVVMKFIVVAATITTPPVWTPPANLRPGNPIPTLPTGLSIRRVLLFEGQDVYGRIQPLLGAVTGTAEPFTGTPLKWADDVTETPAAGDTEEWEIYNTTADSHPIHIHEVLLRVKNRQAIVFNKVAVTAVTGLAVKKNSKPRPPAAYEVGYKDTVICPPGEVTRIVVGPFNVAGFFQWHCHILEHEDHEMMRPYQIL